LLEQLFGHHCIYQLIIALFFNLWFYKQLFDYRNQMWPSIKCLYLIRLVHFKITGNLSLHHLLAFQPVGRNTYFSPFLDLQFLDWLPYHSERLLSHKLCWIYNLYSSYMIALQKLLTKLHLTHSFQELY
jgi:hypothetical protein